MSAAAQSSSTRAAIAGARSVVVKIGSAAITDLNDGLDVERLDRLADALEQRMASGSDVIVVSSGAIGAGLAPLGLRRRPSDLATKQAAAIVGQLALTHAWGTSFGRYGRVVGQVLLTAHDISRRSHHANAQRALDRLRSLGAVAVVNENDAVATNEIRFGDNDRLAALVAHLAGAEALVLLSDVDGLYDGDPRKATDEHPVRFIPEVDGPADLDGVIAGSGGALGTGGMASKLAAARLAADGGIPVLLAAAADAETALRDASVGTAFAARADRMSSRRFWVRHAAETHGRLVLDDGAVDAVRRRRSLLSAGVVDVSGGFSAGDVVELVDQRGALCARGVAGYGAEDVVVMMGRRTDALPADLRGPLVHADDLALL
ncbi:MAG TPA: glutamate 5-kinase [Gordonia sp. (in: high G+C Gram-positive bacteria)]|uniref:glutamate 5-kinase n=1 Tax=unclassified Gordonia (in: high G+C Gram-positive bacteria) TaxID=2657482 RepID=UPI000F9AE377|nr:MULTISPECIES: glutamate 5-kinase [unclassified Gordonia (in: high G+C Gram-positive bacteria)]RUP37626.1 MAG: glutamate 5-kinase [Gordonia sp. (in: high G+C Gram-positive bacteria)]HNP58748.1 glutamate 5-kinase [Gordonia sp. (in: high G+C Gram-positive bacteria)]HRC52479.1 glutamate 5-kinase [Gordonia sp. (in: high G+C Gram-positive bacteria)]